MRYLLFIIFVHISSYSFSQLFVKITDINNLPSSIGKGNINYEYEIGKYEVTNKEYCIFLNSVASKKDSLNLYSDIMGEHFFGGISKSVINDKLVYSVKKGYEKKPVIGVTWYSAIRYINWLHYNAKNIEEGIPISEYVQLTEGDSIYGAYNTMYFEQGKDVVTCITRNKNAIYWLPNDNEWIKAGYYWGDHWNENYIDENANCYDSEKGWSYPYPHIKDVGYNTNPSYYGTYDQQGNVAEWVENISNNGWRIVYGGSLIRPRSFSCISQYEADSPSKSISSFGFRVCRNTSVEFRKKSVDLIKIECSDSISLKVLDPNFGVYVLVNHAGNLGDQVNQFKGSVNYDFFINKYELSNEEYCRFLNAVAVYNDKYNLYNENMNSGACGGIIRYKKSNGTYYYKVKEGWEKRPIVYIGFYDLARYANWLHFGCPNNGTSDVGTTEGTDKLGAYDTRDFEEVRHGSKKPYLNFGMRNRGALYWIPNEDEWYKAAYYDPEKNGNRKYHDYPTRQSDPPSCIQANYMINNKLSIGGPYYIAEVSDYDKFPSYFGTLQQGGNVWEWIESWQYGIIGVRGLKGGSWSYTAYGLNACNTDPGGINDRSYVFGGRLCKAALPSGWQPVEDNLLNCVYNYFKLISYNKFIVLICIFITMIVFNVFLIIKILIRNSK